MPDLKLTKNKHLTLDDREEIAECLDKGMTFKAIARRIGKDPTTVSKEVKKHLIATKPGEGSRRIDSPNVLRLHHSVFHSERLIVFLCPFLSSCSFSNLDYILPKCRRHRCEW